MLFKSESIKFYFRLQKNADVHEFGKMLSEKAKKILTTLQDEKKPFIPSITKNQSCSLHALENICEYFKKDFTFLFKNANHEMVIFFLF